MNQLSTRYSNHEGYSFFLLEDKSILTPVKSYKSFLSFTPISFYTRIEELESIPEKVVLEWLIIDAIHIRKDILIAIFQKGYSQFVFEQLRLGITKVNPKIEAVNQLLSAAQFILLS